MNDAELPAGELLPASLHVRRRRDLAMALTQRLARGRFVRVDVR